MARRRLVAAIPDERLHEWVLEQRWFASKAREVAQLQRARGGHAARGAARCSCSRWSRRASRPARTSSTSCRSACAPAAEGWDDARDRARSTAGPSTTRSPTPRRRASCCTACAARPRSAAEHGIAALPLGRERATPAAAAPSTCGPIGVEQSNSSVVFGDELILKVFRRLEPGVNPELELLRFLSARGLPAHRAAGRLVRVRGPADGRDARHAAGVPRRRARRLGAGARRPRGLRRRARATSAWSRASCTPRSARTPATRTSRPRSRARRTCRC